MKASEPGPWKKELQDYVRAFSGAFLFGAPLLFTMEMWWLGMLAEPPKLMLLLLIAFFANLALAHVVGFKQETTFRTHVDQALDSVAVGIIASLVVLLVLNRIRPGDPLDSMLGKIIVQVVPLSLGSSVANAVFMPGKNRQGQATAQPDRLRATINDIGATMIGGVFIGFSIAPTEEIPMLAGGLSFEHVIALVIFSLVVTYGIVFASGFDPQQFHPPEQDYFRGPLAETIAAYAIALLVSGAALYLFNRVEPSDTPWYVLTQVLVLGVPTAIGGAAGRLVV